MGAVKDIDPTLFARVAHILRADIKDSAWNSDDEIKKAINLVREWERLSTIERCAQRIEELKLSVPPILKKKRAEGFVTGRNLTKRAAALQVRIMAVLDD